VHRREDRTHVLRAPRAAAATAPRSRATSVVDASDDALLSIGHDLRSPIAAAELAIRAVVARGRKPDEPLPLPAWAEERLLCTAERLQGLSRVLGDIIEVARPQPGRGDDLVDLRGIVDEVVRQLLGQLQQAGCTLAVTSEGDTTGRWERAAVFQIVANLITNAIKYGAGRPVRVVACRRVDCVRLEVHDGGAGIAAEEQRHIFEKFARARGTMGIEGHGLGLWIVARAARRLRAQLRVESTPTRGTRFIVDLPGPPRLPGTA
jgi:signal transduction histidine kinase